MKTILSLKKLVIASVIILLMLSASTLKAQSYFGYQTIGKHTFLFSLVWQGELKIGFSYIKRIYGGSTFTDMQTEVRFPLKNIYRFTDYEAIFGFYKPSSINRTFVGLGGHLRWHSQLLEGNRVQKLSLAATAIPSYVYAASLNDGVYGTVGLRLTYAPVIFATSKTKETKTLWNFFPQHKFEGGIHFDMHVERTMSLAINANTNYFLNSKKTFLNEEQPWQIEGDFYFGSTYWLDRQDN